MKIGINMSFVRKSNTGMGQVSFNFCKKLNESIKYQVSSIKQDLEFILYLEEDLPKDFNLQEGFTKRIFLPWWKRDDLIRKIWWEKYLLPRKVKEDECDVFLSLYQCPSIFTPPLNPPLKEEGRDQVKHIMIVHDIIPKLFPEYLNNSRKKLYWKLTEKAIKKADKIIAVSEHTKKDLIKHLNIAPEKISVNYIAVDEIYKKEVSKEKSQEVLKKYNLKPGYIYSGGGLEKRKNLERLLKAYELLTKQITNSPPKADQPRAGKFKIPPLVISGKLMPKLAPLITDVEKLVKDLGLQDKVKLLDFVPQEDLPALYKNASVFVYPSLYEGFGLPVLEAMNCGVPVICSQSSSLSEITNLSLSPFGGEVRRGETNEDSKTFDNTKISKISQEPPSVPMGHLPPEGGEEEYAAVLFDPKNTKDIAEKIEKVLSDNNLRDELSAKGKEQAKKFSWNKFVEKVLIPLLPLGEGARRADEGN